MNDPVGIGTNAGNRVEAKFRVMLALTSTVVSLLLVEGFLRIYLPENFGLNYWPLLYQADDQLGYRYAPNRSSYRQETYEINQPITINSTGFYGEVRPIENKRDATRIAILGDSFTVGFEVPYGSNYPSVLESILNETSPACPCEVLNFGLDGTGTVQHARILERFALKFQPDIVILTFYENDVRDVAFGIPHREEYEGYLLMYRDADPSPLRSTVDSLNAMPWAVRAVLTHSYLARVINRRFFPGTPLNNTIKSKEEPLHTLDAALDIVIEEFRAMDAACQLAKCKFVVVTMPSKFIVAGDVKPARAAIYRDIGLRLEAMEMARFDLLNSFTAHSEGEQLFWQYDSHPTIAGHRLIAQEIAGFLESKIFPDVLSDKSGSGQITHELGTIGSPLVGGEM